MDEAATDRIADSVAAEAILRIVGAIDDYLYSNEHCADGTSRSIFSGPNREKLMGGRTPAGTDIAAEWQRLIHPDDRNANVAHRDRLRRGEPSEVRYRLCGYDGVTRWVHASTRPVKKDGSVFVDGIVADITREVEAEQALEMARAGLESLAAINAELALHDALTGLGNRRKLHGALEAALAGGRPWLMALFDLDGFKSYNDSFGHPAGDDLLVRLAALLRAAMPPDTVFRLGGDEFLVLASDEGDTEAMLEAAARALTETGDGFQISSSFGAVFLPEESSSAESALDICDQRLYTEKSLRSARRGRPQDVLLEALTAREPSLEGHSTEVAALAVAVGRQLALSSETINRIEQSALLHDIGKIGIPDSVLAKPGPLSAEEWKFIRRHTTIGERILAASPALADVAKIVRSTHENVDGTGYPDGLCGEQIPVEARIIAVSDAYSAMTSDRTYRPSLGSDEALAELGRCSGTQFDPAAVAALIAIKTTVAHTG